jgi:two-component system response regulator AtoC
MRDKIMVIDDEPNLRIILDAMLTREGYEVFSFEGFDAALATLNTEDIAVVVTDLSMPGKSGMDVLSYCKQYSPDLPVIMITAFGTVEAAVAALKSGAFDFVLKPFDQKDLFRTVLKAIESKRRRRREPALDAMSALGVGPLALPLLGDEASTQALRAQVDRIASSRSPSLMMGEVGSGKRSIVQEIHRRSDQSRGPFVQLHCDAIPELFQMAELFGVEKGAMPMSLFTKPGSMELANDGILMLEEVGALGVDAQNALSAALENEYFSRVGGARRFPINFRLVVTSSKDLEQAVKEGSFHPELFYKISVETIVLKPLRERQYDMVTHLVPYFIERACRKRGMPTVTCSPLVLKWFQSQPWPGNLGELERKVQQAVNLIQGTELTLNHLQVDPT